MSDVLFIFDSISPYHTARLNAFSKFETLRCLEVFRHGKIYNWDYTSREFENEELENNKTDLQIAVSTFLYLNRNPPDMIFVSGWYRTVDVVAIALLVLNKIPIIIMNDSNWHDFLEDQALLNGSKSA